MNDKKLQEYFNFDEADLEANRHGRLTDKQKKRFAPPKPTKGYEMWGIGLLFLFIAGLGLFFGVIAVTQGPDLGTRIVFGLGFGLLWPAIWGTIGWWMFKPTRRPVPNRLVKAERAPLKLIRHEAPDSIPYFEVQVGSISAETDQDLTEVVAEGELYVAYYIQVTKEMVSLEHISKPK